MPVIILDTEIRAEKSLVFDLSRSIDLHKISTHHTNEEAISGKVSGLIELNETVTWRAKHLGIYQKLTSRITEFQSPDYFVDEMVSGTFKSFYHKHEFSSKEGGRTLMTDTFDFESPFGIFGKVFNKLFLTGYMTNLIKIRNEAIREFAESEKWKMVIQMPSDKQNND